MWVLFRSSSHPSTKRECPVVKSEVLSGASHYIHTKACLLSSAGSMKILYVAPERLNNESFVQMMSQVKIALLAVDEAHCISQVLFSFFSLDPRSDETKVGCQLSTRVPQDSSLL